VIVFTECGQIQFSAAVDTGAKPNDCDQARADDVPIPRASASGVHVRAAPGYKSGTNRITQHHPTSTSINKRLYRWMAVSATKALLALSQRRYISKCKCALAGQADLQDGRSVASRRPPRGLPPPSRGQSCTSRSPIASRAAPGRRAVGLRQVDGMPREPECASSRSGRGTRKAPPAPAQVRTGWRRTAGRPAGTGRPATSPAQSSTLTRKRSYLLSGDGGILPCSYRARRTLAATTLLDKEPTI
jgi:hypothetical protein